METSCPLTQTYSGRSNPPPARHWRAHPCPLPHCHTTSISCHTSISIFILGKHIATILRHNPYSLLRSTARTNLVERSYSQFFFFFFFFRLVSLSRVSLCVFPFLSLTLNPLNQSLNPGPEIEIDFRQ